MMIIEADFISYLFLGINHLSDYNMFGDPHLSDYNMFADKRTSLIYHYLLAKDEHCHNLLEYFTHADRDFLLPNSVFFLLDA